MCISNLELKPLHLYISHEVEKTNQNGAKMIHCKTEIVLLESVQHIWLLFSL